MTIPAHLGGYIEGGDPATYYPELWAWLVSIGVGSVIDVGCGDGQALRYFRSLGVLGEGVDGVAQVPEYIYAHDYTLGAYVPDDYYDLCWSCEFVEHVEEQFIPNFLATFQRADLVLMTHADPGQIGHHHVNCQPSAYWIERLASVDFELDQRLTATTRALAAANANPWNHYVRSGLAFRKLTA